MLASDGDTVHMPVEDDTLEALNKEGPLSMLNDEYLGDGVAENKEDMVVLVDDMAWLVHQNVDVDNDVHTLLSDELLLLSFLG